MLLAGIQANLRLDPRLEHSGVTLSRNHPLTLRTAIFKEVESYLSKRELRAELTPLCTIHRLRLGEERVQDVVDAKVIFLLKARVRDAGHHRELLVWIRQPLEEFDEIVESRDAVELAAHDDRRHWDFRRIDQRKFRAHIDVSPGRH